MQLPVFQRCDRGGAWLEQLGGAIDDRVEHGLHVGWRGGDDLQDVGRGGLPFQGFLGFIEQSRVFDGDRGLIGEALLKRQFVSGERREVVAIHDENADRLALAPQWRAGDGK